MFCSSRILEVLQLDRHLAASWFAALTSYVNSSLQIFSFSKILGPWSNAIFSSQTIWKRLVTSTKKTSPHLCSRLPAWWIRWGWGRAPCKVVVVGGEINDLQICIQTSHQIFWDCKVFPILNWHPTTCQFRFHACVPRKPGHFELKQGRKANPLPESHSGICYQTLAGISVKYLTSATGMAQGPELSTLPMLHGKWIWIIQQDTIPQNRHPAMPFTWNFLTHHPWKCMKKEEKKL